MTTRVVNLRKEPYDVYIGRPRGGSAAGGQIELGNPFTLNVQGTREEVIEKYRGYFANRIATDPDFRARIEGLRGKTLGCFCAPKACHGDVIAEWLEAKS